MPKCVYLSFFKVMILVGGGGVYWTPLICCLYKFSVINSDLYLFYIDEAYHKILKHKVWMCKVLFNISHFWNYFPKSIETRLHPVRFYTAPNITTCQSAVLFIPAELSTWRWHRSVNINVTFEAVAIESDYSSVATGSLWEQALLLFPDIYNVNHFPPLSGLTASNLISSDFPFLCRFISVLFRRECSYMSKVQIRMLHG